VVVEKGAHPLSNPSVTAADILLFIMLNKIIMLSKKINKQQPLKDLIIFFIIF